MRLHIRFQLEREAVIPVDHQHALMGLVYRLLETSDADYSRFLHDEGYRTEEDSTKVSKLFTFSGLRAGRYNREIDRGHLYLRPGPLDWYLTSPRDEFLLHSATGLLTVGSVVTVDTARLRIESVEALPTPTFSERATLFTCISPVVAAVPLPDRKTYYLRPTDAEFSEAIRANLLWKYRLLHGVPPEDDHLLLEFDRAYLANPKNRNGTKMVTFKEIRIIGAFAPFTLTGSTALMQTAWDCGLGEKNGIGFGMVDAHPGGPPK